MAQTVTQISLQNHVDTDGNPLNVGTFYEFNGQAYQYRVGEDGHYFLYDAANNKPIVQDNTPLPPVANNDPGTNNPVPPTAAQFNLPSFPLTWGLGQGSYKDLREQIWSSLYPRDATDQTFHRFSFGAYDPTGTIGGRRNPGGGNTGGPTGTGGMGGPFGGHGGSGGGGGGGTGGGGGGTGGTGTFPPTRGDDPGLIPRQWGLPERPNRNFDFANMGTPPGQTPGLPEPLAGIRGSTPAGGLLSGPAAPIQRILTTPTDRSHGWVPVPQPSPQSGLLGNNKALAVPQGTAGQYATSTSLDLPGPAQGLLGNAPKTPAQPNVAPPSQDYYAASAGPRADYAAWTAQGSPLNQYVNNPDAGEHYNLAQLLAIRNGVYTPPPVTTPNFNYMPPVGGNSNDIYNAWVAAGQPRYAANGLIIDTRGLPDDTGPYGKLY